MKILIFLHGTTIMHKSAAGHTREEIVKQVLDKDKTVHEYASYIPVKNAVKKLKTWEKQGAQIIYFSSHETNQDVDDDKLVLKKYGFPKGKVLFRQNNEKYKDIAERIMPDILIEDDCESIGGEKEMVYPFIKKELKPKIKLIVVKEFAGIDHLPDDISELKDYK